MEPGGVTHVPKPLSPRSRSRVHKVSPTYRSHDVHHLPKQHSQVSRCLTSLVPQPPHKAQTGAVSPGHGHLTASFATRGSRVQIPSAPLNALVRALSGSSVRAAGTRSALLRATEVPQDRGAEHLVLYETLSQAVFMLGDDRSLMPGCRWLSLRARERTREQGLLQACLSYLLPPGKEI